MDSRKLNTIKKQVLKEFKPAQKEIDQSWALFEKIKAFIKTEFKLNCELMGSVAKQTFLKGNKDLDIFILFPKKVKKEQLKKQGLEIGQKVFKKFSGSFQIEYAEHPYTKGIIRGFRVEIVPCYSLKNNEKIISAVDRTPFHTKWINAHLNEKQKDDVLVLKAFLTGIEVYGSSLSVEGFSGYLCELLIAHFGSFENLIENAKGWGNKQLIDPENYHKGKLPDKLKKKFKEDNLIFIDPVDSERNVASVLNEENYAKFIFNSRKIYHNLTKAFFTPSKRKYTLKQLQNEVKKRGTLLIIEFKKPEVIEDILYPQIRRALRRIVKELQEHEFELFEYSFFVGKNKIKFLLDFKLDKLPKAIKNVGPMVYHNEEHMTQFTSKYKNVWVEENRLVTIVNRKFSDAKTLLKQFLKGSQKQLEERGIPDHITKALKGFQLKEVEFQGKDWLDFLAEFLKVG